MIAPGAVHGCAAWCLVHANLVQGRFPHLRRALIAVVLAGQCGVLAAADNARADQAPAPAATAFQFDTDVFQPLGFSRVNRQPETYYPLAERQTEFSFSLQPGLPDFSRAGAYGLGAFGVPELNVNTVYSGPFRLQDSLPDLHQGFAYSAGVKLEQENASIDGTAYVSSSLLGLSYGRLGRLWYGGLDVNIEQFSDEQFGPDHSDVLSLDFTTGRRLGWTGSSSASPLWLLTVQGSFDVSKLDRDEESLKTDWYLNPSLFWQRPGFTFSAQVQVPVDLEALQATDPGEPDYRLRAVFEKVFW